MSNSISFSRWNWRLYLTGRLFLRLASRNWRFLHRWLSHIPNWIGCALVLLARIGVRRFLLNLQPPIANSVWRRPDQRWIGRLLNRVDMSNRLRIRRFRTRFQIGRTLSRFLRIITNNRFLKKPLSEIHNLFFKPHHFFLQNRDLGQQLQCLHHKKPTKKIPINRKKSKFLNT